MKFKAQRGTHDVLPSQSGLWRHVESRFSEVAARYGYNEIRTPVFEDTELFKRTSGDTSEVVTKQMFQFTDKGGRDIALKAEGTAPVVRSYLEHHLGETGAVTKLWYCTPVFRHERPQFLRYRQHHQFGIECIGSALPDADVEVIELAIMFLRDLGLTHLKVQLNSIGRAETRERYREVVLSHGASYLADLDDESQQRALKNPLRLLDSKDPKAVEVFQNVPSILDSLEDDSKAHFEKVQAGLTEAGIPFELKPTIVRGLDYYSDTVFEIESSDLGAQTAMCGGGRYDGLIGLLGGPPTPAVGFGMGIERLIHILESNAKVPEIKGLDVYVVAASSEFQPNARALARKLRSEGIRSEVDLASKSLKGQMKQADKSGAKYAVILGADEIAANTITLRTLSDSSQQSLTFDQLVNFLRS